MPEVLSSLRWRGGWLWLAWSLWAVVMGLSLMPDPPALPDVRFSDKYGHLLAYAVLMTCFGQIYRRRALTALLLVAMGVGVEFLQGLTGRWFDVYDMLANGLGVLIAWSLLQTTALGRSFFWLEALFSSRG